MATYKQLKAKADKLMLQAEAARKSELAAVVAEIQAKMNEHGVTIADLNGSKRKASRRGKVAPKYRHPVTGETWAGRGRVPRWLAAEIAKGQKREKFAVKG